MNFTNPMVKQYLIIFMLLLASCAPYHEQARPALRAYYRGDFAIAAELADSIHPRKADKLVGYLDKATIYHAAKDYKKSIKFFAKAEDLSEKYSTEPIAKQVGAVLTNDNVMTYVADPYERLLIHTYQIMNYTGLGNLEDALVEVRRINTILPNLFTSKDMPQFMRSPFVAYLSALVWESGNFCNDTYIDYKRGEKLLTKPTGLSRDIERSSICAGLSEGKPEPRPNLIVVFEAGRSPIKVSTEHEMPLQIVPLPEYVDEVFEVVGGRVLVNGKKVGQVTKLEDVNSSLRGALAKKMPAIIARAVARLAVKEGAAIAVAEKVDEDLGIILGTLLLATNSADLRSWRTLPDSFQLWRGRLPRGKQTISLELLDQYGKKIGLLKEEVDISKELTVIIFRGIR